MDEPCFQRCPHDRQNPYVQISREMAQDKSISLTARGLLTFLLSLPPNWKIYHSQLQEAAGVGKDCLNSAMEELIKAGYADRTREKVKGMFQPYNYVIREFKKCLPERENRSGLTAAENPQLIKKEEENKEKKQQHTNAGNPTPSGGNPTKIPIPPRTSVSKSDGIPTKPVDKAAAVLSKSANLHYESLNDVDIPMPDKVEISKRYSSDVVKNAVSWALHPETKLSKGLAPAIKWACQNKPEVPKLKKDQNEENMLYAMKYDGLKNSIAEISVLTYAVEITFTTSQRVPIVISYNEKGFKEILDNSLRKCNFPLINGTEKV